jgi:hypothetical protein
MLGGYNVFFSFAFLFEASKYFLLLMRLNIYFPQWRHYRQGRRYPGSIFYFSYGVVVFWCTSVAEEIEVLRDVVVQAEVEPVKAREVSWDQFGLILSSHEQPSIQNDVITITRRSSGVKTKLALSHALAQSTKLTMMEKEVITRPPTPIMIIITISIIYIIITTAEAAVSIKMKKAHRNLEFHLHRRLLHKQYNRQ